MVYWSGRVLLCPISTLLFASTIKSLALRFQQTEEYHGIELGDSIEQIGLYADDIILYMQDTQNTLMKAISIIDTFGQYSGLKINWQKSFLMPLNQELEMEERIDTPFRIVDSFKFLGIYITRQPWDALTVNVNPLMEYIKSMLKRGRGLAMDV